MFWAKEGAHVEIRAVSTHSNRVWLTVDFGPKRGFNTVEVSVVRDDLERAIAEWRKRKQETVTAA